METFGTTTNARSVVDPKEDLLIERIGRDQTVPAEQNEYIEIKLYPVI